MHQKGQVAILPREQFDKTRQWFHNFVPSAKSANKPVEYLNYGTRKTKDKNQIPSSTVFYKR